MSAASGAMSRQKKGNSIFQKQPMYQQRPTGSNTYGNSGKKQRGNEDLMNRQQYLSMEQMEQHKLGGQRANANMYPGLQGAPNAAIRSPPQGYMQGGTNEKKATRQ